MNKIAEGYKQTEVGVIPSDWEVKLLSDISDVKTGPFGSLLHEKDYVVDGTPIITVEHLGEQGVMHENLPMVSDFDRKRLKAYALKIGDIVFSRVGSVDRNSLIEENENGWLFSGRLLRIRVTNDNVSTRYLSYHFHQETTKQRVRSVAVGQTMASLNTQILKCIEVAFPPTKAEQTAIATALNDADALITELEKLIAKKRNIKQGAMQELLKSKKGWEVRTLGDIAEIKDGTHQTPKYFDSGIPFYSVENVTADDFINTKYISQKEHDFLTKNWKIEKGDILMTRIGSIGDCRYVNWDVNASFYVSLALLKVKKQFSAKFICQYSKYSFFKREIEINSLLFAYPKKINLGQISKVKLVIPKSIEEQTSIAQILSDMDAEIEALEKKLEKYKMIKEGVMQELLTGKTRLV